MAWPMEERCKITVIEDFLFHKFYKRLPLMNGKIPPDPGALDFALPDFETVIVMAEDEIRKRLDPALRLPRQIEQYQRLVDYIQNVKDAAHLKRSL